MQNLNYFYNSSTNVTDSGNVSEGILGNIEYILKDKSVREVELNETFGGVAFSSKKSPTVLHYENDLDSLELPYRSQYLEEWLLDFHKMPSRPLDDFFSKQKFEGVVLKVERDSFIARLRNLTENLPDEEAEFSIEDVSKDDFCLLIEGAMFYWNIGYLVLTGGQRVGGHRLNFRRLPAWTRQEIEAADKRAESLIKWLESK